MNQAALPRLWDLIALAEQCEGSRALHLAVGREPMVRIADEGLRPLAEGLPRITWKSIELLLATVVDPDRWNQIEQIGEAEIRLARDTGRPVTLTIFRNSGSWSAVVHL